MLRKIVSASKVIAILAAILYAIEYSFANGSEEGHSYNAMLELNRCNSGTRVISQWKDNKLIPVKGKFMHNDHINYTTATIKNIQKYNSTTGTKEYCQVSIHTYIEGADVAFICNFPESMKVFEFPAILKPNQQWKVFDKENDYCHYVH